MLQAFFARRVIIACIIGSLFVGAATFHLIFSSPQVSSLTQSVNLRVRRNTVSERVTKSSTILSATSRNTFPNNMASIPAIIYGTAWKKERTAALVEQAIRAGFRGVDTACQPKHYYEPGVGEGLAKVIQEGLVKREDIFLQTKFTSFNGQDPKNIPYDPQSPIAEQVRTSFATSLRNLQTTYLDSLVMHSPMSTVEDTMTVWRTFEEFHQAGQVRYLGLSNTYNLRVLQAVYDEAHIKPTFLQNRFYRESGYDVEIRRFCREKGIRYQSFWTLTANPNIVNSKLVDRLSTKYGKTREQIFFRFIQSLDIIPLSGTTNAQHMQDDVNVASFNLEEEEVQMIESLLPR